MTLGQRAEDHHSRIPRRPHRPVRLDDKIPSRRLGNVITRTPDPRSHLHCAGRLPVIDLHQLLRNAGPSQPPPKIPAPRV